MTESAAYMSQKDGPSPFEKAALEYWRAGWVTVLPLQVNAAQPKGMPPKGFTGGTGQSVKWDQLQSWLEHAQTGVNWNIGLRAQGWIGIDVDDYDAKNGATTLRKAFEVLGTLPDTISSTSRGANQESKIYFYRIPLGKDFTGSETKLRNKFGSDVEIIHKFHRYCIVGPSIHPSGRAYEWYNSAGQAMNGYGVPGIEAMADLPEAWVSFLAADDKEAEANEKRRTDRAAGIDVSHIEAMAWLYEDRGSGECCAEVGGQLEADIQALASMTSRHETMLAAVQSFAYLNAEGHGGAGSAVSGYIEAWSEVVGKDKKRTQDISGEVNAAIRGAVKIALQKHPDKPDKDPCDDMEIDLSVDSGKANDGRSKVNVTDVTQAGHWLRNELGTGELSGIFRRGDEIVHTPRIGEAGYIEPDDGHDGPAQVRSLSQNELKAKIEVRYDIGKNKQNRDKHDNLLPGKKWVPALFPLAAVQHAYNAGAIDEGVPNLRILRGITHTPMMRADGSVLKTPGYDVDTKFLYLPEDNTRFDIPDNPSPEDVREARGLLITPIAEFPFLDDNHRANWLGMAMTPVLRGIFPPPYQIGLIDAPSPGSGKSFLANMLRILHGGVIRSSFTSEEAETKKAITSILMTTTGSVIVIDNVRGIIKTTSLEALATSADWSDRVLGRTEQTKLVNDRLWIMTGNNATVGGDLKRRTLMVTIDPKIPNPYLRQFTIPDVLGWMKEHKTEYIKAILTIARAWYVAGAPKPSHVRSDDYVRWISGIRGIMEYAELEGLFASVDAREDGSDDDEAAEFFHELFSFFGKKWFTVKEIIDFLDKHDAGPTIRADALPSYLADRYRIGAWDTRPDARFTKSMGRYLQQRAGRYFGDLSVERGHKSNQGMQYRISRHSG